MHQIKKGTCGCTVKNVTSVHADKWILCNEETQPTLKIVGRMSYNYKPAPCRAKLISETAWLNRLGRKNSQLWWVSGDNHYDSFSCNTFRLLHNCLQHYQIMPNADFLNYFLNFRLAHASLLTSLLFILWMIDAWDQSHVEISRRGSCAHTTASYCSRCLACSNDWLLYWDEPSWALTAWAPFSMHRSLTNFNEAWALSTTQDVFVKQLLWALMRH